MGQRILGLFVLGLAVVILLDLLSILTLPTSFAAGLRAVGLFAGGLLLGGWIRRYRKRNALNLGSDLKSAANG